MNYVRILILFIAMNPGHDLLAQGARRSSPIPPITIENSVDPVKIEKWFATPGDYDNRDTSSKGVWVKIPFDRIPSKLAVPAKGIVTLRARLQFLDQGSWGLFSLETIGTSRFRLNGRLLPHYGNPGKTSEEHVLSRGNHVHYFSTEPGEIVEIAIEIANWSRKEGMSFYEAPIVGEASLITKHISWLTGFDQWLFGSLMIIGCYHLALYMLRPEQKMNRYFAIYCMLIALRSTLDGDSHFFAQLFPQYADHNLWKLELLFLYSSFSVFQYFIMELFPELFSIKICRIISILSTIFFVLTIFLDLEQVWVLLKSYQIILVITAIYDLTVVLLSYKKGNQDAGIFLLSGLFIFICAINDVLHFQQYINTMKTITVGVLGFIFSTSYLISRRFSKAFSRAEKAESEIRQLNMNLEHKVEEQTRDIKMILKNIHQGVLTITSSKNFTIDSHYSTHLHHLVEEENIEGKNVIELIFRNSNLSSDKINSIMAVIHVSLGESLFSWELNKDILINEFSRDFNGKLNFFEIDWIPIINDDMVTKILVTIRDVTSVRTLRSQAIENRQELKMISEIVNISQQKFAEIIQQATQIFGKIEHKLRSNQDINEIIKTIFIDYHTFKGICRSYELDAMSNCIHQAENRLEQSRDELQVNALSDLQKDLALCIDLTNKYIEINTQKLGRNVKQNLIEIADRNKFQTSLSQLSKLDVTKLSTNDRRAFDESVKVLQGSFSQETQSIFTDIFKIVPKLANDLGKRAPNIEFSGNEIVMDTKQATLMRNIFIHLIRNSMDHGIEASNERLLKGKSEFGKICIQIKEAESNIVIKYSDDGKGLNLEELRNLGIKKNLIKNTDVDVISIAKLIFTLDFQQQIM